MSICYLALGNGHVSLSKNTISWKKSAPPPPNGGQSYCAFVLGRGKEVKEDNISLKGHLFGKPTDR